LDGKGLDAGGTSDVKSVLQRAGIIPAEKWGNSEIFNGGDKG